MYVCRNMISRPPAKRSAWTARPDLRITQSCTQNCSCLTQTTRVTSKHTRKVRLVLVLVCFPSCLVFDLYSHIHPTTCPHTCVGLCCFATEYNSISEDFCEHNAPINWLAKNKDLTEVEITESHREKDQYDKLVRNMDWRAVVHAFKNRAGTGRARFKRNSPLNQWVVSQHAPTKVRCVQINTKGVDSRKLIPGRIKLRRQPIKPH